MAVLLGICHQTAFSLVQHLHRLRIQLFQTLFENYLGIDVRLEDLDDARLVKVYEGVQLFKVSGLESYSHIN